jgi:2,3-diaminopropionate biosynthesis protein SbnB
MQSHEPSFAIISGTTVRDVLKDQHRPLVKLVEDAYLLHASGTTVNPPSYFLQFPDRPSARIIALPASLGGDSPVDGLKWISSFPENVSRGLPRASAVLILNDPSTGYPYACLEASVISATRTAASAALAADWLSRDRDRPRRVGFIGTGLISRYVYDYLVNTGWSFEQVALYDLSADHALRFQRSIENTPGAGTITRHSTIEDAVKASDLLVFATVAGQPHVDDPGLLAHHPLVLHLSLRDLSPRMVLASANFVDDIDHCLRASTSPHLAEQLSGGRDFIDGTLSDVINGKVRVPADRTVLFSPFGLGVLDLAVGRYVYDVVRMRRDLLVIYDFYADTRP